MIAKQIQPYVTHFTYQVDDCMHGKEVVVGGKINSIKRPVNGFGPYVFTLDDQIGDLEIICSQACYENYQPILKNNTIIILYGIYNKHAKWVHAYRIESFTGGNLDG